LPHSLTLHPDEISFQEERKDLPYVCQEENDIRVAVIGNVDSGKSSLVGVLTKSILDDGRGFARSKVFNYSHEHKNGRTSSIAHEIMGFDGASRQVVPDAKTDCKNKLWSIIASKSERFITFLDLCGHEKYLKTTIYGMVGLMPDYAMVIVGANMGVSRISKEHLGIAFALKLPIFIVITKIDLAPLEVKQKTIESISNILKAMEKSAILIQSDNKGKDQLLSIDSNTQVPVFQVSNVTGEGIEILKFFLSSVKSRVKFNPLFKTAKDNVKFFVHNIYNPKGIGLVVAGTMLAGTVTVNDTLLLGPMKDGKFKLVNIKSIHRKRTVTPNAIAGQSACFNLKPVKTKELLTKECFRKGMVLISKTIDPVPSWEFDAEVVILHHSAVVQVGSQFVVHCGVIRQACKIIEISKGPLRAGDKGIVKFRFIYNAEYISNGMTILLRDGCTKGLGIISSITCCQKKKYRT
jgi:GTPase